MHDRTRITEYIRPPEKFPRQIIERLSKGGKVTIAACFKFDEGVLFCADTKITTDAKTNQTKIFAKDYTGPGSYCATVFVLAGSVLYARAAIADCESRIGGLDFSQVSMEDIRKEIAAGLIEFYQEHMYPNPEMPIYQFELLVGVWLRGETRMFMSKNTVVIPVSNYECIGSGSYLARYWIRQFMESDKKGSYRESSLVDIALISAYALNSAMEYDESCGGEAEFLVMKKNGEIGFEVNATVYPCEEMAEQFHRALWPMLRKLVRANDEIDSDIAIEDFITEAREIGKRRTEWITMIANQLKQSLEPRSDG